MSLAYVMTSINRGLSLVDDFLAWYEVGKYEL